MKLGAKLSGGEKYVITYIKIIEGVINPSGTKIHIHHDCWSVYTSCS